MAARFDDIQSSQFQQKLQLVTLADELHRVETAAMITWTQQAPDARGGHESASQRKLHDVYRVLGPLLPFSDWSRQA